jgi:hypothetical protein
MWPFARPDVGVVSHHHHGHARLPPQALHQDMDVGADAGIEYAERLVQQQGARGRRSSACANASRRCTPPESCGG